jgi:hypothetical protein
VIRHAGEISFGKHDRQGTPATPIRQRCVRFHDPETLDRLFGVQSTAMLGDYIRGCTRVQNAANDTFLFVQLLSNQVSGDVHPDL